MYPITVKFPSSALGRVVFPVSVMTGDRLSFKLISFKLDTGSDFTTLSCRNLEYLGYTEEVLKQCKLHGKAYTATAGAVELRYLENISIKLGDREIQGCRIYFALGSDLHSLFGSDILKYFNTEIKNDTGDLRLYIRNTNPLLTSGETKLHIYAVE